MSIGKNIAEYRKAKNLTQIELGNILNVSGQTVSKWENGLTVPDTLLIPQIAQALSVSLDELYGLNTSKTAKADQFPEASYDMLFRYFVKCSKAKFTNIDPSDDAQIQYMKSRVHNGCFMGCYSNIAGTTFISDSIAFIDRTYKAPESEKIFACDHIVRRLKYLSDKNLLKVLEYEYKTAFERSKADNSGFYVNETASACCLSEDETEECLEKLTTLGLNVPYHDTSHKIQYYFMMQNAVFAFAIFMLAEMLNDDKVWTIIRDTSMINDYAFK